MATVFRPMSGAEIFDRALRIYRTHFVTLFAIAALAQIPSLVLTPLLSAVAPAPPPAALPEGLSPEFAQVFKALNLQQTMGSGAAGLLSLVGIVVGLLAFAAVSVAVSRAYHGEEPTIGDAYGRAFRSLGHLAIALLIAVLGVGAAVLVGVVVMVVGVFAIVLGAATGGSSAGAGGAVLAAIIGVVLMLAPVALLGVWWFSFPQAIVFEGRPGPEALGRSRQLVRGSWWRVLGILLLGYVLLGALQAALVAALGGGMLAAVIGLRAQAIPALPYVMALVGALVAPVQYGIVTLLYYDLRVRKEGLDLQQMAGLAASQP